VWLECDSQIAIRSVLLRNLNFVILTSLLWDLFVNGGRKIGMFGFLMFIGKQIYMVVDCFVGLAQNKEIGFHVLSEPALEYKLLFQFL